MLSIKDAALKDTGMKTFTIEAPAKINRYLKIVGVKDDKHLIETNFQSVSIYDKLSFEKIESGFENELVIKNNSEISQQIKIPTDSDNLVFKAFNFLNIKSGYRVYLEKNIPISAGLAGGSADAAGVLLAMEALENKKLVYSEIGAKLGADIPFMIEAAKKHNNSDYNDNSSNVNSRNENAAKKCVNRHGSRFGDVLSVETKELSKCSYFVIGVQSYGLSTPRVYSLYDKIGGVESTTENDTTENDLLENNLLGNDLQKAALSLAPKLEQVLEVALENGANRSYITGSGPTAVAEVNSLDVAKQIETAWKKPYTENFNAVNAYTQNPKTESLASKVFIVENR